MNKYIFPANLIALLLLVPAIFIGYLHDNTKNDLRNEPHEIVRESTKSMDGKVSLELFNILRVN